MNGKYVSQINLPSNFYSLSVFLHSTIFFRPLCKPTEENNYTSYLISFSSLIFFELINQYYQVCVSQLLAGCTNVPWNLWSWTAHICALNDESSRRPSIAKKGGKWDPFGMKSIILNQSYFQLSEKEKMSLNVHTQRWKYTSPQHCALNTPFFNSVSGLIIAGLGCKF